MLLQQKTITINYKISFLVIIVGIVYTVLFFIIKQPFLGLVGFVTVSILSLSFLFLKLKRYTLANCILIITTNVATSFFSVMIGGNSGIQDFFYGLCILSFVLFNFNSNRKQIGGVIFSMGCWVIVHFLQINIDPIFLASKNINLLIKTLTGITNFVILGLSFEFYLNSINKSQNYLQKSNQSLQQANKKIKANTKQELYLNMARGLQAQFLPDIPKKIKLYGGCYHFETIYKPSNQLSGDLYDFHIKGDMVKIFHGDIVGKNVPAMMVALNVRSELKHLLRTEGAPHVLMDRLNGLIRKIRASMAVCAGVYYELNLKTKEMTYVHMGFEDIYIIRDQGVIDLGEEGGAQLGYIEDIEYKQEKVMLQKGDIIVTLSDGMSDMKNQTGERYSENKNLQEMLRSYVKETPMPSTESLRGWIENEIETYTGELEVYADDISVFIANYQS